MNRSPILDGVTEEVYPGVTNTWIKNKRIYITSLSTSTQDAINAFVNQLEANIQALPPNQIVLAVNDISGAQVAFTPYYRRRITEFMNAHPTLQGRIALVIPKSAIGRIFQLFVNVAVRRDKAVPDTEIRMFFNLSEAIEWLEEALN